MRFIWKKIKVVALLTATLLWAIVPITEVAAAGKTTIAVSDDSVEVGDTVSVTIKAKAESGSSTKAKMKVTYDDDILKFVSCSATYDGGAGGSVTATASSMTIKFEAIAAGKSPIYVDASDGVEDSSTNIEVSAGANTSSGKLSKDNSLKSLSLSAGTLSPAFAGNVVKYTVTVPNDVTSVEVNAETANDKASIESIAGNTDLQLGLNTIRIVVEAENGALATYTIELTREEAADVASPEETPEEIPEDPVAFTETETAPSEIIEETDEEEQNRYQDLENSYRQLEEKYQREKAFSRKVIYTLFFVIGLLIVIMINVIVHYRRKLEDDFEDDFDDDFEEKPVKKSTPQKVEEKKPEDKKPEVKKLEVKKPESKKQEEPKKEVAPKVEVRNNLEVFDFNDED